jgi:hypothetical protein
MHSRQSLIIILVALALTVIGPSLSVQGAMAATNGQNGENGGTPQEHGGAGGAGNTQR